MITLQHVKIKKGHQSHLTPPSAHFLSPLHSTHSKGSSSLCWSANSPQGCPSPFTQQEGRKFFLVLNRMAPNSIYKTKQNLSHALNKYLLCTYHVVTVPQIYQGLLYDQYTSANTPHGNSAILFAISVSLPKRGVFLLLKSTIQS